MHFFGFSLFFCYFWFFLKNYQNMGQKLGSNSCPLFTMLTKQNSSMFCIVSFVKKRKREMISLSWATCHLLKKNGLFPGATCPHIFKVVYFQGRPAHTLTLVYFHGRPAHTYSKWSLFRGDQPTHSHWSIFTGDLPTHTHFGLFSGATCPHTHTGLFSRATCPFDWVYLRSHLAI
jgi:hypothetical protein